MAEKEATIYIVDVGKSMGERRHGRPVTDLEWAMQYVWDKITATVRLQGIRSDFVLRIKGGHWPKNRKCRRTWIEDRRYVWPS